MAPADPRMEEREESTLLRLLRGIPITIAIAVSFFLVFVTVPMQRIASMVRRRLDVHVPLVTDARAYQVVAAEIAATLNRHNFAVAAREPPWWLTAPSRVLLGLGGSSFRAYIPERLAYFRGPRLDIVLYPNGLLLRGREQDTAWAHGVVVEALSDAPAYQTFDPRAQDVERQIRNVWRAFQRNPEAHKASPWLETRFGEIAEDIRELPVSYDEWQIVYRQALQLGRALRCERQLLEKPQASTGNEARTQPEEASMVKSEHGDSIRAQSVPTRDLLSGIVNKATLLARKEVELVKAEIKADLQSLYLDGQEPGHRRALRGVGAQRPPGGGRVGPGAVCGPVAGRARPGWGARGGRRDAGVRRLGATCGESAGLDPKDSQGGFAMGERASGLGNGGETGDQPGESPRDASRHLEGEITLLREEIGGMVVEIDRRRHELTDVRLQVRRHAVGVTVTAVALIAVVAGAVWFGLERRTRQQGLLEPDDSAAPGGRAYDRSARTSGGRADRDGQDPDGGGDRRRRHARQKGPGARRPVGAGRTRVSTRWHARDPLWLARSSREWLRCGPWDGRHRGSPARRIERQVAGEQSLDKNHSLGVRGQFVRDHDSRAGLVPKKWPAVRWRLFSPESLPANHADWEIRTCGRVRTMVRTARGRPGPR